jgi:hypothetical protein
MRIVRALALLAAMASLGCATTIGLSVPAARERTDFGPPAVVHVCLLRDEAIREETARDIGNALDREMEPYQITVEVPWVRVWHRPSFFHGGILADVGARPLEPPCDRLLALVGRNTADRLWALFFPEILGEVEDDTHTRGFAVGAIGSLYQLVHPPSGTAVHEFYHMLGCPHALTMRSCYRQIALTKSYVRAASGFFPGLALDLHPLLSRHEVDALLSSHRTPTPGH